MIFSSLLIASALCGVVPERDDDFFWENELFGMRAYGPGDRHCWSGFDVFNKLHGAGSVGDLLREHDKRGNWHTTPSDGILDNYVVGAGRGVGAIAVRGDGEWKTYGNWRDARIIAQGGDFCEFELVYPAFSALGEMTYRIKLEKNSRFFSNTVSFENELPDGFCAGPGLDVNPARNHDGTLWRDSRSGAAALFETERGATEGVTATGIFIDPADAANVKIETDAQGCLVLSLRKRSFTYWAGAAWSNAGDIESFDAWLECLKNKRNSILERKR